MIPHMMSVLPVRSIFVSTTKDGAVSRIDGAVFSFANNGGREAAIAAATAHSERLVEKQTRAGIRADATLSERQEAHRRMSHE